MCAVAMMLASCGGGAANETPGTGSTGLASTQCGEFGFAGEATRSADDGMGQAAGTYTTDDFTQARAQGGSWTTVLVTSFELPADLPFLQPDVPEGGVSMRIDIVDPTEGVTGELGSGNPGLPPLISNGGTGTNQNETDGTYTVIEATTSALCVEVDYTDDHQTIDGVFVAPLLES